MFKSLKDAPPPRRTSTGLLPSAGARPIVASSDGPMPRMVSIKESIAIDHVNSSPRSAAPVDDFNAALYIAKAFGIATAAVLALGTTTVWGVKSYLGVNTVRLLTSPKRSGLLRDFQTAEFAQTMRRIIATHMPVFSSRLLRETEEEDGIFHITSDGTAEQDAQNWAWPDAEKRLQAAFEKNGFSGWAEAAVRELEAERKLEQRKRDQHS